MNVGVFQSNVSVNLLLNKNTGNMLKVGARKHVIFIILILIITLFVMV